MSNSPKIQYAILCWLCSLSLTAQPNALTDRAEALTKNVVKLEVAYEYGGTGYGHGFVTNEQAGKLFIVTAGHVIHGESAEEIPGKITLLFAGDDARQLEARELRWLEGADISLLEVEKPAAYEWVKDFMAPDVAKYTDVRFIGNRFANFDANEIYELGNNHELYFSPAFILPGVSGAPLISESGIVGIILEDSQENAQALSIWRVRDLLKTATGDSPYFHESGIPGVEKLIKVNGFAFKMGDQYKEGDADELPVHTVTVKDFWMSPTEVSNQELADFLNAKGNQIIDAGFGKLPWYNDRDKKARIMLIDGNFQVKSGYELHPANCLNWYGALHFCNWRSEQEGLQAVYKIKDSKVIANWSANGYRLPTEAEWEYAAREGGRKVRFANGQDIARAAEMNFNSSAILEKSYSEGGVFRNEALPVNTLSKNALGFYHMAGNAREWCWDIYDRNYYSSNNNGQNLKGPASGKYRTVRGCSYASIPADCRVTARQWLHASVRFEDVGFRLVRNVQ